MNAKITNSHHFSKGVELTINEGKLVWNVDWVQQKYKFGSWPFKPIVSKLDGTLDATNSLDDFIMKIQLIYEFTGLDNDWLDYYFKIESDDKIHVYDIIDLIYKEPLEHKVKFVCIGHCGCNMGHCDAVTGIYIDPKEYQTYGDLMALFGDEVEENGFTHYTYPDSVHFSLERIKELPNNIHDGSSCYSKLVPVTETLDPEVVYLAWSFGR